MTRETSRLFELTRNGSIRLEQCTRKIAQQNWRVTSPRESSTNRLLTEPTIRETIKVNFYAKLERKTKAKTKAKTNKTKNCASIWRPEVERDAAVREQIIGNHMLLCRLCDLFNWYFWQNQLTDNENGKWRNVKADCDGTQCVFCKDNGSSFG